MSNQTEKSPFKLNRRQKWVCAPESLVLRVNYKWLTTDLEKKNIQGT